MIEFGAGGLHRIFSAITRLTIQEDTKQSIKEIRIISETMRNLLNHCSTDALAVAEMKEREYESD